MGKYIGAVLVALAVGIGILLLAMRAYAHEGTYIPATGMPCESIYESYTNPAVAHFPPPQQVWICERQS